jgi:hypothetical protein
MRKRILSMLIVIATTTGYAQVSADKSIVMTGANESDRRLIHVGTPEESHNLLNTSSVLSGSAVYPAVSGTASAIILSFSPPLASLSEGQVFFFNPTAANTGAVTISADGLPAYPVQLYGAALAGGELTSGVIRKLIFSGTAFEIQ